MASRLVRTSTRRPHLSNSTTSPPRQVLSGVTTVERLRRQTVRVSTCTCAPACACDASTIAATTHRQSLRDSTCACDAAATAATTGEPCRCTARLRVVRRRPAACTLYAAFCGTQPRSSARNLAAILAHDKPAPRATKRKYPTVVTGVAIWPTVARRTMLVPVAMRQRVARVKKPGRRRMIASLKMLAHKSTSGRGCMIPHKAC